MRATSDNPDLAQAAGIDVNRVITLVWFLGGGLAGAGGVLSLVAIRRINPDTGFKLLLFAFAVVILGGIGSFYGAILAACIVGFAENYGVYFLMGMQEKYPTFSQSLYESEPKLIFLALLLIHSLVYGILLVFIEIKENKIKYMRPLTMGQYLLTSSLILIMGFPLIADNIKDILDHKSNMIEYIYQLYQSILPFAILVLVLPLFYGIYLLSVDTKENNDKYMKSLTIGHLILIICLILKVGLPFSLATMYPLSFSVGYKPAIAFAILITTLLFRPRGLMGLPEEAGKEE
jgi:branched-subunit amino acid ABC-type transport system permease component